MINPVRHGTAAGSVLFVIGPGGIFVIAVREKRQSGVGWMVPGNVVCGGVRATTGLCCGGQRTALRVNQ